MPGFVCRLRALGLEALSRGAREVVFVESAQAAARVLAGAIGPLRRTAQGPVSWSRARLGFLRNVPGAARTPRRPFDIVFLDPPFGQDALAEYVPLLDAGPWLKPNALVYMENERKAGVPQVPPHWEVLKSKSAGEVGYHLLRVNAPL